ncbi:MAG: DUF1553 domain-containing protein [Pirellulaceae bacterium]
MILKQLIRTIATSYVYGLSSEPSDRNVADTQNYSRHYRQRLRAEVLLDAVADVSQVPFDFSAARFPSLGNLDASHRFDFSRYLWPS